MAACFLKCKSYISFESLLKIDLSLTEKNFPSRTIWKIFQIYQNFWFKYICLRNQSNINMIICVDVMWLYSIYCHIVGADDVGENLQKYVFLHSTF